MLMESRDSVTNVFVARDAHVTATQESVRQIVDEISVFYNSDLKRLTYFVFAHKISLMSLLFMSHYWEILFSVAVFLSFFVKSLPKHLACPASLCPLWIVQPLVHPETLVFHTDRPALLNERSCHGMSVGKD